MGLRAKNVLLNIVRSHFWTKMVFLQLSIIQIFYAHENSFFHHISLSQLANKQLFQNGQASLYVYDACKVFLRYFIFLGRQVFLAKKMLAFYTVKNHEVKKGYRRTKCMKCNLEYVCLFFQVLCYVEQVQEYLKELSYNHDGNSRNSFTYNSLISRNQCFDLF